MGDVTPDIMVRELQLINRLGDIGKAFDHYVEHPTETTHLMSCLDDLHQISSLMNLLGWSSASYLVDKIRLTVQALLQVSMSEQTLFCQDSHQVCQSLRASLQVLPTLLAKTDEARAVTIDQHCHHLDGLISGRLSSTSNCQIYRPFLSSETVVFEPLVTPSKILSTRHLQALEQRDMRSWLRKTRQLLQAATLQLLRDEDVANASKRLQLCFSKLNRGCGYTQHGRIWLPALIFSEWLQDQGALPLTIRSILRQLDLHLKQVADGSLEQLNQPPSDLLILQLVLYPTLANASQAGYDQRLQGLVASSDYSLRESLTVARTVGLMLLNIEHLRQELEEIDSLTTDARQKCRQLAEGLQGCIDLAQLLNQEAIAALFLQQQRQLRRLSVSGEQDFQAYQPTCLLVMDQIRHRLQPLADFSDPLANVVFHEQSENITYAYQQLRQLQTELINLNKPHPAQGQLAILMGHLQQFEMTLIHLNVPRLTAVIAALSNTLQQLRMDTELPLIPFYQVWAEIFCAVHYLFDRLLFSDDSNCQQPVSPVIQRAEQALAILNAEAGISPSLAMDERESDEADLLALISQEFAEQLEILQQQWLSYSHQRTSSALAKMRLAFHTIKGSSRVLGAHLMADLAWSSEEICTRLLEDCYDMTPELTTVIEDSIHWIDRLMQLIQQGTEADDDLRQAIESGREVISHWLDHCFELNVSDILTDDSEPHADTIADSQVTQQWVAGHQTRDSQAPSIALPEKAELELLTRELSEDIYPQRQALQNFIRQSWRENFSNTISSDLVRQVEQFCLKTSTSLLPQLPPLARQIQQLIVVTPANANGSALTDLLARYEQLLLEIDQFLQTLVINEEPLELEALMTHQQTLMQDAQRYIAKWQDQMHVANHAADTKPEPQLNSQPDNALTKDYDQVLNRLIEVDALLGHWIQASNKEDLLNINGQLAEVLLLTNDDELASIHTLAKALHQFFDRLIQAPIFDSTVNGAPITIHDELIELASTSHDALLNMMDQVVAGQSPSINDECVRALNDYVVADAAINRPLVTCNSKQQIPSSGEGSGENEAIDQETAVVMAIFLEEAEEIADSMEQSLGQWQAAPNNWVAVGELQSAAATLASGAKMAQLSDLQHLCATLENVYRSMAEAQCQIDDQWFRLLQRSQDVVNQIINGLAGNRGNLTRVKIDGLIKQLNAMIEMVESQEDVFQQQQMKTDAANDGAINGMVDDRPLQLNHDNQYDASPIADEIDKLLLEVNAITNIVNTIKTMGMEKRNLTTSSDNNLDYLAQVNFDILKSLLGIQNRLRGHAQTALEHLHR